VLYLAAFTCGLLNNQPMGFYSPAVLIKDAQRHGLRVRPIDVQRSEWLCTLEHAESESTTVSGHNDPVSGHDFSRVSMGLLPTQGHENRPEAFAPEGRTENSPGRKPWVWQPAELQSPVGATETGAMILKGIDNVFDRAADAEKTPWALAPAGISLRIGLNYVKGLRQASAAALLAARRKDGPFASIDQLAARVPELSRKELVALASVGALNPLDAVEHRRDALWQVEQAGRPVGPLLREAADNHTTSKPLKRMTTGERLTADYAGTGITTGPHPMAWHRERLRREGILSAEELGGRAGNSPVRIAGRVICRQRPGTAKGFVFLSLEDETGIANIILTPDVFEQNRLVATRSRFLSVAGKLQNQDSVIHVKAQSIAPWDEAIDWAGGPDDSRNFH